MGIDAVHENREKEGLSMKTTYHASIGPSFPPAAEIADPIKENLAISIPSTLKDLIQSLR